MSYIDCNIPLKLIIFNSWKFFFSSVTQSCPTLCDPITAAHQASLPVTNSWSSPKPMSIESVMPSNHLILCHPLFLLPSIFPSIRVFSNESALRSRWPKYWSFSFSILPINTQDWSLGWTGWISLQSKGLSRVFSNTTVQKQKFFLLKCHYIWYLMTEFGAEDIIELSILIV